MNILNEMQQLDDVRLGIDAKINEKRRDILKLESKPIGPKEFAVRQQLRVGIAELEDMKGDLDWLLSKAQKRHSDQVKRIKCSAAWDAIVNRMNNPTFDFDCLIEDRLTEEDVAG
jgi:hypothetical protein